MKFFYRILVPFVLLFFSQLRATDYYVRSGGGNFSAAGTWSLSSNGPADGSVPTAADNIYLDASSGNLTIDVASVCRSINCSGYTGTLTHAAAVTLTIGDATAGTSNIALKFVAGMTYTLGNVSTSAISFISTNSAIQTIDFGGKTTGNVTLNGSGGAWRFLSSHTIGATALVTLTAGTFYTNGFACTWGRFNSGGGTLSLGASYVTLLGTGTIWQNPSTLSINTSTIEISDTSAVAKTFTGGSITNYNNIKFTGDNITITGNNRFLGNFQVNNAGLATGLLLTSGSTQTIFGNFTTNGSAGNLAKLLSVTAASAANITKPSGLVSVDYMSIKDIAAQTGLNCVWVAGANSSNVSGNSGWLFVANTARFWVGGGSSTAWDAVGPTNWSLTSGGANNASVPTSTENVFFDENSGTGTSVLGNNITIRSLNCQGYQGTISHSAAVKLSIGDATAGLGNIALRFFPSMTYSIGNSTTSEIEFISTSTTVQSVDFYGKTTGNVTFNGVGGSWRYAGLHSTGSLATVTLTNGTLNLNSQSVTWGLFNSNNANTRVLTLGFAKISLIGLGNVWDFTDVTNLTFNTNSSSIILSDTTSTAKTFIGGGQTFYNVVFAGDNITINGSNTFHEMRVQNAGLTNGLLLTAGSTQTVTGFTTNGSSGNLAIIKSTIAASAATITKASGVVSVDYMSIQDITAATSGTATWYAGSNSINVSGNGGGVPWSFTKPPGRYWVGGGSSPNWNATGPTNWATSSGGANNASVPSITDDVFLEGSSAITINATASCRSLDCSGYSGLLTHKAGNYIGSSYTGIALNIGDSSGGSASAGNRAIKFSSGMTYSLEDPAKSAINFVTSSTVQHSVDFDTKITGNITYNGTGAIWIYQNNHTATEYKATISLVRGTLNTNGKTINCGQFNSSFTTTRTLTLGNTALNIKVIQNESFNINTSTGLTLTPHNATVNIYRSINDQAGATFIRTPTNINNYLTLNYYGGGIATFATGNTLGLYKDIVINGSSDLYGNEDRLQMNVSVGFTGTLRINGHSGSRRLRIHNGGGFAVPNAKAFTCQYTDFQSVIIQGPTIDLSNMTGGACDLGGNSNIIFTTSGLTCYWYSSSSGRKEWNDVNNWFLGSGGTGGQARVPLLIDNVVFDSSSFGSASTVVWVGPDMRRLGKDITWSGVNNNPRWHFEAGSVSSYGSLTLDNNMTFSATGSQSYSLSGNGSNQTFTLTTANRLIPFDFFFVNMIDSSNKVVLMDTFNGNSTNTTQLRNVFGILDLNNQNVTTGSIRFDVASSILGSGLINLTGIGTVFNNASAAISASSVNIELSNATTGAKTFAGGGATFNNITISGAGNAIYTFSGNNRFNNFTDSKTVTHSLVFTASSNTTFTGNINVIGSSGNLVTLTSTTTTAFTWTKTSGTVNCDYLILSRSTAAGGATFDAGINSINAGGNTGWTLPATNNFTWTGATNNNWSNSGNWFGGAVPGVNDIAYFTGIATINCTIDSGCNVKGINVGNGYTGVITQADILTIGTYGIEITGGTLTCATQNISCSGPFRQINGTFTNTSGTFNIDAQGSSTDTWSVTGGTHNKSTGTVKVNGTSNAIINNSSTRQFHHFEINTSGIVSGTFFVDGNLTRSAGTTLDANISVKLDYLGSGAGSSSAGTGTITFNGTGLQSFTYPYAPSVTINKASGTLDVPANITVGGNWNFSSGTISWNSKKVTFDNSSSSDMSISKGSFYEIEINRNSNYNILIFDKCTISNKLTITSLKELNSYLGSTAASYLELNGDFVTNLNSWTGTSKIVFSGNTTNTFSGTGKHGLNTEINKSGGILELYSHLNIYNPGNNLSIYAGKLDLRGNNLTVNNRLQVFDSLALKGNETITVNSLTTPALTNPSFTIATTSSTIIYTDSAVTANITNLSKTFYNLTLGAGKTHEINTGVGNGITVNGAFASNGSNVNRSILRSASDVSTDWKLTLNGTSTLSNKVNVKRSDASGGLGVLAVGSINSGNNTNWVGLVTPPTITSITSSTANGTYTTGANISIRINFSETVTLTGTLGINLDSGGVCVINAFTATTATGTYTVGSGQNSSDLTASSVVVSGTVQNASLVDLVTTLPSTNIATGSNIVIDTTAPTVTSVNSSTSNGSYKVGSSISVTVNFSESVTVTGTPTLLLETGATDRTINYVSGSGSSALVFSYTVQTGDTSSDLDYNATNSLSGTIKDSALNNATLTLASPGAANSLGANKAIIIDTTAPSITSITSSTANGSYKSGSAISIRINFSENITLTGTMGINLDSGGVCVISAFTGTTTTGTYTVASGQTSSDLTASSVVVNTTARDAALNDLSTTLPGTNIATGSNIVIDTTAPTITSITSSTTNGTYGVGANISIRINFSENITLTGTMGINLDSGGVCVISAFTGTTATGTYTVGSSQTSADLTASSVTVNTTARDAALNNLTTTLPSTNIATGSNIVIDTTAPTITTKALGSSNAYIDVTFSEAVYTTNTTSGGLLIADFNLAFAANGGTATAVSITGVTKTTGAATSGGETTVRLTLSVTGSVSGTETITITPVAASVFDAAGNAASTSTTTGAVTLQANLPPAVTQVTSSTTNGTYKAGDTVSIQVVFDAAVTVTGTPQLTLETGSTDRTIDYVSGSGSTSLTFTYTVQSGDTSSDLDYTATTALSLNSGTIKSAASINATLVLPTPGTSNSLGSNKALVIDTTAPTVTSVSSTTSDGSYGLASVITISVIFNEAVTVTGVPTLALETGFVDQTASYSSGSGTTTLLFTYTVQSADTSSDLDYSSTTALALSSGTIKDAAGNSATLTLATPGATNSLSSNKAIVIDTTSPIVMTVGSSTADGAYKAGSIISITVTFTEAVVVTGSPTLTLETGTTDRNATYNSGSGSNILVFTYTVQSGDSSSDLDYTSTSALALSSGTIKDAAGNAATLTLAVPGATNSLGSANNIVVDTTSPSITDKALSTGATYVDITFSEPVYTSAGSGALTSADFTVTFVKNGGTATGVAISSLVNTSGVALSGGETVIRAMLTISGAIAGVETFSISPKSNEIFDLAGNASTTTGTGSIAIVDTLSPTVLSVDTTNVDGAYKAGSTIVITVTFSEAVTVSGTPSLTLETGLTDAVATYVSGSDTDTLTFAYTVQSGEKSSDLDYKASTALVTNGGSIVDAASNVATLTLVTPGDAGSLSSNADIEIDTTLPTVKKAEMSSNNDYVDITFSEPVFTQAGTGALIPSNFILVTQANAGTSISVTVTSILTTDETALVGGETKVRMHISITGTTKGNEKIVIQTLADTVFDKAGNAMLPLNETVNIKTQTVVGGGSSAGGCTYTPNATLNQNADWGLVLIFIFFTSLIGRGIRRKK